MSAGKNSRGARRSNAAPTALDHHTASDLARRALANIRREYPNHPQYLLTADEDLAPPRVQHPTFYGCFDWHSAVHTHWLLARLLNKAPDFVPAAEISAALSESFEPDKLRAEAEYLRLHPMFERPYGLAWLVLLGAEVASGRGSAVFDWMRALSPAVTAALDNLKLWMTRLRYPVRSGTHNQSAFALTLLFDAAWATQDEELLELIRTTARSSYAADRNAPLHVEPSGEDFFSPALMEADLMRRVLPQADFPAWLSAFLPGIPEQADDAWLPCAEVVDATDGKLVHLAGLNLSRAWNLEYVAAALPADDRRIAALRAAAERHREAGVQTALANRDYAGDHWLPSFAVYLLTARGRAR
jgi:hypothetical protein